ncbi:Splicing factor U2af small subunit A [Camellia lanceoleosa]|uniref:Splicing factor U2af small subunit A n=1 Tax=Camellia lanceoleosa TaxID=1840588 RepID=A0ACC0FWG5_9ERIC|nr:Splicing factor U2af small subunit A [Camellia lanceoleosa]
MTEPLQKRNKGTAKENNGVQSLIRFRFFNTARIMYYWFKQFKDGPNSEMGGFTRILHSGKPDSFMDEIPTFVAQPLPAGTDQIYRQIGEKYGVQYSETEILNRYRRAYEQPWGRSRLRYVNDGRPFWQYIVSSSTGCSDSQYFEEFFEALIGYNCFGVIECTFFSLGIKSEAWHLCDPDAEKVFKTLRNAGVKLAVVSNFDTRLRPVLWALNCDYWFDAVAVSAEVEAEKPIPTIFIKACELLGVKPEDANHVGDDRRNNVWGARDADSAVNLWMASPPSSDDLSSESLMESHTRSVDPLLNSLTSFTKIAGLAWSSREPWIFASLSYDGRDFYEDLFEELSKYGEIESLNICDNLADHMVGNVYVQFREEEHAATALRNLTGRFYAGRPIIVDFSPVTDFREATCRQYEENACNCGGYYNFMHLKRIGREMRRQLFERYRSRHSHSRSRSRSPYRHRSYDERPHGGCGHSRRYDDEDYYHESRSKRNRTTSPGHRRGRSRSPGGRRNQSPVREGSEERHAKIEQWNREKEQSEKANKGNTYGSNNNNESNEDQYYGNQQRRGYGY